MCATESMLIRTPRSHTRFNKSMSLQQACRRACSTAGTWCRGYAPRPDLRPPPWPLPWCRQQRAAICNQHALESAHIQLYQGLLCYFAVLKRREKRLSSSPPCGSRVSIWNLFSLDFFSALSAAGSHLPMLESVYYFLAVNHLPLGSIFFWI